MTRRIFKSVCVFGFLACGACGSQTVPLGTAVGSSGGSGGTRSAAGVGGSAGEQASGGAGQSGAPNGTAGSASTAPPTCVDTVDSDHDGIADVLEGRAFDGGASRDTDGDATPDYLDSDSDNDGIPDKDEADNPLLPLGTPGRTRTNPCSPVADTDKDGIPDFEDTDSDNDGVPDKQDAHLCPNKNCRVLADCDGDGVPDAEELAIGSDPCSGPAPPTPGP